MPSESKKSSKYPDVRIWVPAILLAYFFTALKYKEWAEDLKDPGQFGDMFGAFNAFFAGLAFIAVAVTLFLQTRQVEMQAEELRLQREEMRATRAELARSTKAQQSSALTLHTQLRNQIRSSRLSALPVVLSNRCLQLGHLYANATWASKSQDFSRFSPDAIEERIDRQQQEMEDLQRKLVSLANENERAEIQNNYAEKAAFCDAANEYLTLYRDLEFLYNEISSSDQGPD